MAPDTSSTEFALALRTSIQLRGGMCCVLLVFLIGLSVLPGASTLVIPMALCLTVFGANVILWAWLRRGGSPLVIVHGGYLVDVAGYSAAILCTGGPESPFAPLYANVVMGAGLLGLGYAAFYATLCGIVGIGMLWAPSWILGPVVSPPIFAGSLVLDNITILAHASIAIGLFRNRTLTEQTKLQAVKDDLQKSFDEVTVYERQQRELNESLKASMRSRSQFLAMMSHELRTPLNSVIGFADLMLEPNLKTTDEERRVFLGHIQRGGRNLLAIIDNLIDLSRLSAGTLVLRTDEVNVERIAQDAYEATLPHATARGLTLERQIAEDLPRVVADPKRLRQILTELLDNALRFTRAGGRVSLNGEPGDQGVWLSVIDTGEGIPQEHLDRIFEPFHQVDSSTRRKHEGTGLGLAVVHTFVEAMGGRIEMRSTVGEGTTMSLFLPLRPKTVVEPEPPRLPDGHA